MDDLFLVISLLAIVGLVIGLINPTWVKLATRKSVSLWFGGAVVVFFTFFGITSDNSSGPVTVASEDKAEVAVETTNNEAPAREQVTEVAKTEEVAATDSKSKADAQKELDEFMELSKKATLVTSYEFSESANVVYVGKIWYPQTAIQKKDFLAYVADLKKKATGYHRFEVKDAYSDEVVAEVTAFSGALKVYK